MIRSETLPLDLRFDLKISIRTIIKLWQITYLLTDSKHVT